MAEPGGPGHEDHQKEAAGDDAGFDKVWGIKSEGVGNHSADDQDDEDHRCHGQIAEEAGQGHLLEFGEVLFCDGEVFIDLISPWFHIDFVFGGADGLCTTAQQCLETAIAIEGQHSAFIQFIDPFALVFEGSKKGGIIASLVAELCLEVPLCGHLLGLELAEPALATLAGEAWQIPQGEVFESIDAILPRFMLGPDGCLLGVQALLDFLAATAMHRSGLFRGFLELPVGGIPAAADVFGKGFFLPGKVCHGGLEVSQEIKAPADT